MDCVGQWESENISIPAKNNIVDDSDALRVVDNPGEGKERRQINKRIKEIEKYEWFKGKLTCYWNVKDSFKKNTNSNKNKTKRPC